MDGQLYHESKEPTNKEVAVTVQKLIDYLRTEPKVEQSAPHLTHYRNLPEDVQRAYVLMKDGSQLVYSTSTKYTLVGKIDEQEQKKLGYDLLRGCELLAAATHILLQDGSGCSRAVRRSACRASLGVFMSVVHLCKSFDDGSAKEQNVGAQKTGAVWDACNVFLNKTLPQGNRSAVRRELLTWTRDCQDTMEEFQEMVDAGPADRGDGDVDEEEEGDTFGDEEDQYTEQELTIASGCLGLLKNSRGNMRVALETCEHLGLRGLESGDETYFDQITEIYNRARSVGGGVTDLGSVMYPPLAPSALSTLESEARRQAQSMSSLLDYVLGLEHLPESVSLLAGTINAASKTRLQETIESIQLLVSQQES